MRYFAVGLIVLGLTLTADARGRRFFRQRQAPSCSTGNCQQVQVTRPKVEPLPSVKVEVESVKVEVQVDTGALAAANAMRARRGMRPFIHAPQLQPYATAQANRQARRGWMGHQGTRFGPGARGEGVGGRCQQFNTCYLYSHYRYAAAASANGFHCLQVR